MNLQMIGNSGMQKINPPGERQSEVLDLLQEECGELIQAASKIKRCGIDFVPSNEYARASAKTEFTKEVMDVLLLIAEANQMGLIDHSLIGHYTAEKQSKLRTWTHFAGYGPIDGAMRMLTDGT